MNDTLILGVAVFVFIMMMIGLGLTILEFNHGQPKREQERAKQRLQEVHEH